MADGSNNAAVDQEALAPLIELCKRGQLFEVQRWIADGKPVNPPPKPAKGNRPKSPLEVAIERGFHSVVQVLLEAGARQEPDGYHCPMNRVLRARRFDLVQLLVAHGFDPKTVDMSEVFATWDPSIMEFFIDRGAEIRRGRPFARAMCERIRTAVGPFKRSRERMPDLQEQADVALRYHCKEGNLKWVSLMLWAGADPYSPGSDNPETELGDEDEGLSALGFAALYEHFEVFELTPIRSRAIGPAAADVLRYLTGGKGLEILRRSLEKGLDPNDQPGGGCSCIGNCIEEMSWDWSPRVDPWEVAGGKRKLDTERARDRLKAIHLLAKHGAKWVPAGAGEINSARRSLLKMKADYTVEFVWIMSKYRSCSRESIEQLLRSPTMRTHTGSHRQRLDELLRAWA